MSLHDQLAKAVETLDRHTGYGLGYFQIEIWSDGSGRVYFKQGDAVVAEFPFDTDEGHTLDKVLEMLAPTTSPAAAFLSAYAPEKQ